ncbi:MAG: class I SAM-dependent methyltransferase [Candidatus Binataceae bacterium]
MCAAQQHGSSAAFRFDPDTDLPGAIFLGQMWLYALSVLYPVRALKSLGLYRRNSIGQYPSRLPTRGEGQFYSNSCRRPVYLAGKSSQHSSVKEFDRGAELYSSLVAPATRPVHEEAFALIRRFVISSASILDVSCGPGTELTRLAAMVPDGEVVGIDLATAMVAAAFTNAQRQGFHNTAFFQADVAKLPKHFYGRFDAVHCSFAFHH